MLSTNALTAATRSSHDAMVNSDKFRVGVFFGGSAPLSWSIKSLRLRTDTY